MSRIMQTTTRLVLIALSITMASCGSFDPGDRKAIDEEALTHVLQDVGFTVPDGFEFGQAYTYSEFVGEPARSARFDAPAGYGDGRAVSSANPSYPPMRPITCTGVPAGDWGSLGFTCVPPILMTRYPQSGGLDSVTVLLTQDERSSHLFLRSTGH